MLPNYGNILDVVVADTDVCVCVCVYNIVYTNIKHE